MNREPFSYDLNGDVLYQQYRDQYARNGQLAMMDSMGMAAALNGGYGSSYGQGVGQQSYNQYLQGLNEVVPELYDRAYNRYQQEGQDLLNQYSLTGDLRDAEYQQYQNALNNYWQNVNYLSGRADTAYERGYNDWYNNVSLSTETEEREYQRALEAAAATGDYSAMGNFGWTAQQIQSANRQNTGSGYTGKSLRAGNDAKDISEKSELPRFEDIKSAQDYLKNHLDWSDKERIDKTIFIRRTVARNYKQF